MMPPVPSNARLSVQSMQNEVHEVVRTFNVDRVVPHLKSMQWMLLAIVILSESLKCPDARPRLAKGGNDAKLLYLGAFEDIAKREGMLPEEVARLGWALSKQS